MNDTSPTPLSTDGRRTALTGRAKKLFQENIKTLRKAFPEKTRLLADVDLRSGRYTTLAGTDGLPVLIGFDEWGQLRICDNLEHPVVTQEEWYRSFAKEDPGYCIMVGFGAGHLSRIIGEEIHRIEHLIVIEDVPEILGVACATYDLSGLVESGKVSFWVPEDEYEAVKWFREWLKEQQIADETPVSFFLNPPFLVSSPQYLWKLCARLGYKYDRFRNLPGMVASRFPAIPGWSERWAECLSKVGVAQLEGKGEGTPAVVVGSQVLTAAEEEMVAKISAGGHLVIADADRFDKSPVPASALVCLEGNPPPAGQHPGLALFASAVAVGTYEFPKETICFWAEGGPTVKETLPAYTTPSLLCEMGQLVRQLNPVGTSFDLAVTLGCNPILLVGISGDCSQPEVSRMTNEQLALIGLREQVRSSGKEVVCVSPSVQESIPEARLMDPTECLQRLDALPSFQPSEAQREALSGKITLSAPKTPIDRSLVMGGRTIIDGLGRLPLGPEGPILEAIFKHNLQALRQSLPQVAEVVEKSLESDSGEEFYRIGVGVEKYPFLEIGDGSNTLAVLPGTPNPWNGIANTEFWRKLHTECGNVFLGIGLGYYLEGALERCQESVVLWEPVPSRLIAAMHVRNLVPLFQEPRIEWTVGRSAEEFVGNLISYRIPLAFRAPPFWQPIVEPELRALCEPHAQAFREAISKRLDDVRAARRAMVEIVKPRARRYLRNSVRTAEAVSMDRLRNRFEGIPAVIVAAGPSLDQNVHLLNEIQGRALIFVVDTSYRVVQPRDIDRDFVVTVDPKEATRTHFADRIPRSEDILIATSGTPEDLWDMFPDPKIFGDFLSEHDSTPIIQWLSEVVGYEISRFWGGGSVAISALGAAHTMGCKPLILIGQDLAVLPDKTHASDTIYPEKSKQPKKVVEIDIPALGGGTTKTTRSLLSIKRNLEHHIRWYGLDVINATAFGARIEGTREVPFEEVLAGLPENRVCAREVVQEVASELPPNRLHRLKMAIQEWEGNLKSIRAKSEEMLPRLEDLLRRIGRRDYPSDCGKACNQIINSLIEMGFNSLPLRRMEDFYYQDAIEYIELERRIQEAPTTRKRLQWQVERTIPLLQALQRGHDSVQAEITQLLEALEEAETCQD